MSGRLEHEIIFNSEELRRRCRMTSKIQYNQAEVWHWVNGGLGLSSAVLGVVAMARSNAALPSPLAKASPILAGAAAAMLAYLEPADRAAKSHCAGVDYGRVERQARDWEILARPLLQRFPIDSEKLIQLRKDKAQLDEDKLRLDRNAPLASEVVKWYTKWALGRKPLDK